MSHVELNLCIIYMFYCIFPVFLSYNKRWMQPALLLWCWHNLIPKTGHWHFTSSFEHMFLPTEIMGCLDIVRFSAVFPPLPLETSVNIFSPNYLKDCGSTRARICCSMVLADDDCCIHWGESARLVTLCALAHFTLGKKWWTKWRWNVAGGKNAKMFTSIVLFPQQPFGRKVITSIHSDPF